MDASQTAMLSNLGLPYYGTQVIILFQGIAGCQKYIYR